MSKDDDDLPPPQQIDSVSQLLNGLAQSQVGLTTAVQALAHMQVSHMKANFEAMPLSQRDTYCQEMKKSGINNSQLEQITEKSYSTINRHLNGKNKSK